MPKVVNDEEYLDTREVLAELGASKKRFYGNVKPQLKVYHFEGLKAPWYRKRDILALKNGTLPRAASIVISGILSNWTTHVRALGYQADTKTREITIETLPDETAATFGIEASQQ